MTMFSDGVAISVSTKCSEWAAKCSEWVVYAERVTYLGEREERREGGTDRKRKGRQRGRGGRVSRRGRVKKGEGIEEGGGKGKIPTHWRSTFQLAKCS